VDSIWYFWGSAIGGVSGIVRNCRDLLWRFRYYLASDEWVRDFGLPPQAPRHVFIWFLIAAGLIFVGVFVASSPL
jgi:hypothetical protein